MHQRILILKFPQKYYVFNIDNIEQLSISLIKINAALVSKEQNFFQHQTFGK